MITDKMFEFVYGLTIISWFHKKLKLSAQMMYSAGSGEASALKPVARLRFRLGDPIDCDRAL
jgi:hypothetical protein